MGENLKSALITGISGQDGFHLSELLLSKNYKIFGLVNNDKKSNVIEFSNKYPEVEIVLGDLTDISSLIRVIEYSKPAELYNLGGVSSVSLSFSKPELSANVNGLGPVRLLESIKRLGADKDIRFYQASSSEMFGDVNQVPQNEMTEFSPKSPYGAAKVYAHQICVNYRESYGMHVSCGILFNHESEYRSEEFVTRKITKSVAQIAKGKLDKVKLGTLEPKRDWGYAGDYVEAMWLMMQQQTPDDYVIATGKMHSVRDFLTASLKAAGLKGNVEDYVVLDENLKRPSEVDLLVGDPSKAKKILGWQPKVSFEELVLKMVTHDMGG